MSAARASSTNNHMNQVPRTRLGIGAGIVGTAALLGLLAGCAQPPTMPPDAAPASPPSTAAPSDSGPTAAPPETIERPVARWVRARWDDLPGWHGDLLLQAWPALRAACSDPKPAWREWCAHVQLRADDDETGLRSLLQELLQPYRVEDLSGASTGMATGYFEPLIEARRRPDERHRFALHAPPPDLAARQPYWTREQLETSARASLAGREIAWVADPLDVLMLQIQGSGRVRITEPDGSPGLRRLAYAGHNGQPYRSVGRWLIDQGELPPDGASWPAIRAWARSQPAARVRAMLWANPRVVFFREEPLPDPSVGPRGAMGVPLTPGRSIAVDPRSIPYGTPVWLDTTEPLSNVPLQRLVSAQDTGSAIVGAVRADYFWGWGDGAEAQAGRMKQPLRMWVLWPRRAPPPPREDAPG